MTNKEKREIYKKGCFAGAGFSNVSCTDRALSEYPPEFRKVSYTPRQMHSSFGSMEYRVNAGVLQSKPSHSDSWSVVSDGRWTQEFVESLLDLFKNPMTEE